MKPEAVIYDIDGTLVDITGLEDWMTGARIDFDVFHSHASSCPPIPWVVENVQYDWANGRQILLVTARGNEFRESTMLWLAQHNIPYSLLAMREEGDSRSDLAVKSEMILELMEHYTILNAFEDNPEICDWLESVGILTWKVGCR